MTITFIGVEVDKPSAGLNDFVEFHISEVKYIEVIRPKGKSQNIPIYHTTRGSYAPILTIRDLTIALNPRGFRQMDKSYLVNQERVTKTEKTDWGIVVTFDDNTCINVAKRSRKR